MSELVLKAAEAVDGQTRGRAGERDLVVGCRNGDPEAFARLVALHERMVFNLAVRLLGDPEEARDMAQDVFLQIYNTLHRFEGRSSLKTWIYRIVVNQCANRRRLWGRRRRSRAVAIDNLALRDEALLATTAEQSPEAGCSRREQQERIQRALAAVSFEHRAILLLREAEDLSCDEIAAALRIPVGTVKSRLSRAREALRIALGGPEGATS